MEINLAIDAFRLVAEPRTSGAFVVAGFVHALEQSDAIQRILLLLPRSPDENFMFDDLLLFSKVEIVCPSRSYFPEKNFRSQVKWIQFVIPTLLKNTRVTHLLAPYHQTPILLPRSMKTITIICDICGILPSAGYYYHKKGPYRHWFNFITALCRADAFIYISRYTKKAFERVFPIAKYRPSTVIYPVPDCRLLPELNEKEVETALVNLRLSKKEYFFTFGAGGIRKGFDLTVKAFELYRKRGGLKRLAVLAPSSMKKQVESAIPKNLLEAVVFLSDLSVTELSAVYRGAIACVFPSRCEGFGYPVLESMLQGCPPIAWRNTPAEEIIAEVVPTLKSLNPQEIVDCMMLYDQKNIDDLEILGHIIRTRAMEFIEQINVAERFTELVKTL